MNLKGKNIGEVMDALEEIKSNSNHNFTEDEVSELLKFEADIITIGQNISKVMEPIIKGIGAFKKWMDIQVKPIFEDIKHLTSLGWYISPYVIDEYAMTDLYRLTRPENIIEFEETIINNSDRLIDDTIKKCSTLFPNRSTIFIEIHNSYKNKFYHSVISLSYTQADGICNEKWGCPFFQKDKVNNYEFRVYPKLNTDDRSFSLSFADQLKVVENEMTLNSNDNIFNEETKKRSTFNRHRVLHGQSVEFGIQKNALRAILLLDFLCYFVEIDKSNSSVIQENEKNK